MKPYAVIWSHSAVENDLARVVVQAMERGFPIGNINRAMHAIDRLLGHNPNQQGESRSGFERVLLVFPLSVVFEVYEDERVVYITRVGGTSRSA